MPYTPDKTRQLCKGKKTKQQDETTRSDPTAPNNSTNMFLNNEKEKGKQTNRNQSHGRTLVTLSNSVAALASDRSDNPVGKKSGGESMQTKYWDMRAKIHPGFFPLRGNNNPRAERKLQHRTAAAAHVPVVPSRTDRTAEAKPSPSPKPPSFRREGGQVPVSRTRRNSSLSAAIVLVQV